MFIILKMGLSAEKVFGRLNQKLLNPCRLIDNSPLPTLKRITAVVRPPLPTQNLETTNHTQSLVTRADLNIG